MTLCAAPSTRIPDTTLLPDASGTSSVSPFGEPVAVKLKVFAVNEGIDSAVATRACQNCSQAAVLYMGIEFACAYCKTVWP